jgi:putative holliday junction resolvase
MKYLGVDFGTRKIGVALGDDMTLLAFPLGNIDGGDLAFATLLDVARREGAGAFVVGLPIPDVHQTEHQLEIVKRFVRDLESISKMKVYVVDEQFSSAEARRLQREYGSEMSEDALAATIFLQAYLDGDRDLTLDTAKRRDE